MHIVGMFKEISAYQAMNTRECRMIEM